MIINDCLNEMEKGFSRSFKTTPALKGEKEIVPLGNIKGGFMVNISFEKSFP